MYFHHILNSIFFKYIIYKLIKHNLIIQINYHILEKMQKIMIEKQYSLRVFFITKKHKCKYYYNTNYISLKCKYIYFIFKYDNIHKTHLLLQVEHISIIL